MCREMEPNEAARERSLYRSLQVLERREGQLSEAERLRAVSGPLLSWFRENARDLPWRRNPEPYRVWISEIMLQQTRVEAVRPYFARFMEALPDVESLARVEEDRLLKLWEGLGYYSRARNLKAAAGLIMERFGGQMPASYEELLELPGIGSYTAGAIASIAFGIPVPAADGNVLRVLTRLLGSFEDISRPQTRKRIEKLLRENMDTRDPSAFNQGLIEIGALVCVPNGSPKCGVCPLASVCVARQKGLWDEIPVKPSKKARKTVDLTVFVITDGRNVALRKRPAGGLLASLYEFPNQEGKLDIKDRHRAAEVLELEVDGVEEIRSLGEAKHIFSHVEWHMVGYEIRLKGPVPECFLSAEPSELEEKYPLPNAFLAYKKAFLRNN